VHPWIDGYAAANMDAMTHEELDYRTNDGIEVSLLWNRLDNSLSVRVIDAKTRERFRVAVRADEAMDAFRHPFAYARAA
jgi:hypothetical protein